MICYINRNVNFTIVTSCGFWCDHGVYPIIFNIYVFSLFKIDERNILAFHISTSVTSRSFCCGHGVSLIIFIIYDFYISKIDRPVSGEREPEEDHRHVLKSKNFLAHTPDLRRHIELHGMKVRWDQTHTRIAP
jgi:hypothetical protein